MRSPGRYRLVKLGGLLRTELQARFPAATLQRVREHFRIGLPGPKHLVEAIAGPILAESFDPLRVKLIGIELPRHFRELHVDERAVAVEGDVLGARNLHLVLSSRRWEVALQ